VALAVALVAASHLAVPTETKTHGMRMPIVPIMLDLVVDKDCLTYEKAIDAIKPCL
jgi:hypothetical protein